MISPRFAAIAFAMQVLVFTGTAAFSQSLCVPTIGTLGQLNRPSDIALAGPFAVIADESAGLAIVDVSIPSDPVLVGSVVIPRAQLVAVEDSLALVTDRESLRIIDFSSPQAPLEIGRLNIGGTVGALAVADGVAYLSAYYYDYEGRWDGLKIVDFNDGSRPRQIGHLPFPASDYPWSIVARDDLLFVPLSGGLVIFDVSEPANPVEIGRFDPGARARSVAITGALALVIVGDGVRLVDISNPSQPTEIGTYEIREEWLVRDVVVSGDIALVFLVGYRENRIRVIDISDPSNVVMTYELETSGRRALSETLAFVARFGSPGLEILDFSNPSAPVQIGELRSRYLRTVTCHAGFAFTVGHDAFGHDANFLGVAAVPATGNPFHIGSYTAPGDIADFVISNGRGYVAVAGGGVVVLDVTNPAISPSWPPSRQRTPIGDWQSLTQSCMCSLKAGSRYSMLQTPKPPG